MKPGQKAARNGAGVSSMEQFQQKEDPVPGSMAAQHSL